MRDDIVLKSGHKVCALHFSENDILWQKEIKGPDGSIF